MWDKYNGFSLHFGEELNRRRFCDWLAIASTCEKSCEKLITEVQMSVVLECFCDLLTTWLTYNWPLGFYVTLPLLHLHYINPYYLQNCKKSFKEKTLEIYLGVRECHPSIIYTFLLVFFTLYPLNFHIPWEELSLNKIHTHSECREQFRSIWEALSSYQFLIGAIGHNCRIRKANEDKTWWSPLVTRAWRAQVLCIA